MAAIAAFMINLMRSTKTQALHFSGKNVRLSSLPSSKTFLKFEKTILSRGGRRKLFNSSLMNKKRVSE